ncbi:MAG: hypothetical protein A2622_00120 [Bdellovibrionales bacterium RIFCSPHIGHO2_01_FULL_40_29]|nr:MAG: hypothetical protein A2622_00120 [Bdellovibrionales bacterium RIFCSPHIGHO2_01_FULL_40_29]OFZ32533.1 MAG: hypothetical protein A3D17_04720 [Bdellovibrionales bacterium RIFCSPHIGHO2_02_FULL_40_15]
MTFCHKTALLFIVLSIPLQSQSLEVLGGKEVKQQTVSQSAPSTSSSGYSGKRHSFFGGLNAYTRSINKTTSSTSGKKDVIAPLQFPVMIGYSYALNSESKISTQLDYTLFPKKGVDGGVSESHIIFRLPYSRKIAKTNWDWRAGLAFHQTRLVGGGGPIILNNGTGTAPFGTADGTVLSNVFATELGINYRFDKRMSTQVSFIIEAPLQTRRRTISLLSGVVYDFGDN